MSEFESNSTNARSADNNNMYSGSTRMPHDVPSARTRQPFLQSNVGRRLVIGFEPNSPATNRNVCIFPQ